jgi:diphosphomevalonate decarboxylase
MRAAAEARTNIALVKYWGKCDAELNLPAVPSLSLTLEGLLTRTAVWLSPERQRDALWINDREEPGEALLRVMRHLDRVAGPDRPRAEVRSWNNFPTAAGLASSASAFAALTLAAAAAAGQDLDPVRLSALARQGSGSAARSLFGGLVILSAGTPGQADSARAHKLLPADGWPELRLVLGIVSDDPKETPSTGGMNRTAATSPYYPAWVAGAPEDLQAAVLAVLARDLEQLGAVTERSALRMHASAMAADPGVVYLRGPTIEGLHAVRRLRQAGTPAWFTCDAGPHPKALTTAACAEQVAAALSAVPGVRRTLIARPGGPARLIPLESGPPLQSAGEGSGVRS